MIWPVNLRAQLRCVETIHHKKKDGDRNIYLCNCKLFKLDKSNAVSVGKTAVKPYRSVCLVGLVWFARYCGKMYSSNHFSYGGLARTSLILNWELKHARFGD